MALANLVRVTSATSGTGTITLGSAVAGFLTPVQAGATDGLTYTYAIEADYVTVGDDLVPTSREVGTGTLGGTGTTLTRSVINSTNSNALLNLTGDEQVIICPVASAGALLFDNTGLHILDTNASHDLIISPGSNLTADRTLTVTTGDANVTLDLTAVTDEFVLAYDTGTNAWRGVAAGAGVPTTITVANEATDTTCFPLFATAATGDLGPKTNAGLLWDSSARILTVTNNATAVVPAAQSYLHIIGGNAQDARINFDAFAGEPTFIFRRAQNTAASPSQVTSGLLLGGFEARGYHSGGAYSTGRAQISMLTTEAWTNTANGTKISLWTTPNGSTTQIESLIAENSGTLTVTSATASTSGTTGALVVGGGIGLAGALGLGGGHIIFPATLNPSSDVNTLDDYEEGTWTPVITFDTPGNLSITYGTQGGYYTKIGRLVTLHVRLATSAFTHTTASGNFIITGLPFSLGVDLAYGNLANFRGITLTGGYTQMGFVHISGTTLNIVQCGSGAAPLFINTTHVPTGGTVELGFTHSYMHPG